MSIVTTRIALDWFVAQIERKNPFAFVRYGDGEFNCVLGADGENCDHHLYYPDLGVALRATLTQPHSPPYFYAMGPKASRSLRIGVHVERWLTQNAPNVEWRNSETFLNAALSGDLYPLIHALNERRLMIVGGSHLRDLPVLQPLTHVKTPLVNAWLSHEQIHMAILAHAPKVDTILFCAGMTAKVLMWQLYPQLKDHILLDLGSLFDVYCGVDSRKYARLMPGARKQELLNANFHNIPIEASPFVLV